MKKGNLGKQHNSQRSIVSTDREVRDGRKHSELRRKRKGSRQQKACGKPADLRGYCLLFPTTARQPHGLLAEMTV